MDEQNPSPMSEYEYKLLSTEQLQGQPMEFKRYTRWSEAWDHDHCLGCWATFAEFDGPQFLHEGWATTDAYDLGAEYDWLCPKCFEELRGAHRLTVAPAPPAA